MAKGTLYNIVVARFSTKLCLDITRVVPRLLLRKANGFMGTARLMIALFATITAAKAQPKNVLYIVYDDLRPDLSAYDVKFMDTPNIQKLADTGTVFERAYCQEAVCSPSRNSFATGRRPNTTAVWNFVSAKLQGRSV